MNYSLVLLVGLLGQNALGQNRELCSRALADGTFQVPALAIGQPTAVQVRTFIPLFSESGMDFYGADRSKYIHGQPIGENGTWILAIFRDENRRQSESQRLMLRLKNPHLNDEYASSLKYVVVFMGLEIDRNSDVYKTWMKCSSKTSSREKCPLPQDVPLVSEVEYYQPNQCITTLAGGLLFDDRLPEEARTNPVYPPPVPLSFQESLSKAADLMIGRFRNEDEAKKQKQ